MLLPSFQFFAMAAGPNPNPNADGADQAAAAKSAAKDLKKKKDEKKDEDLVSGGVFLRIRCLPYICMVFFCNLMTRGCLMRSRTRIWP